MEDNADSISSRGFKNPQWQKAQTWNTQYTILTKTFPKRTFSSSHSFFQTTQFPPHTLKCNYLLIIWRKIQHKNFQLNTTMAKALSICIVIDRLTYSAKIIPNANLRNIETTEVKVIVSCNAAYCFCKQ